MGGNTSTDASNMPNDGADAGGGQERVEVRNNRPAGANSEDQDARREEEDAEDGLPAVQIVNDNSVRYDTEQTPTKSTYGTVAKFNKKDSSPTTRQ